jgi:hypothetical protein
LVPPSAALLLATFQKKIAALLLMPKIAALLLYIGLGRQTLGLAPPLKTTLRHRTLFLLRSAARKLFVALRLVVPRHPSV